MVITEPGGRGISYHCSQQDGGSSGRGGRGKRSKLSGLPDARDTSLEATIKRHEQLIEHHEPGYSSPDEATEFLSQLAHSRFSDTTGRLGKRLLKAKVDTGVVRQVLQMFDFYYPEEERDPDAPKKKGRASELLFNILSGSGDEGKNDDTLTRVLMLVDGFVHSYDSFAMGNALIKAQARAPVSTFYDDVKILGCAVRYGPEGCTGTKRHKDYFLQRMPKSMRKVLRKIVDEAVEWNLRAQQGERRQYRNLGNAVLSFAPFTGPHHPRTRKIVRKIQAKDKRNILYDFYSLVGSISPRAPDSLMVLVDDVADCIPDFGAMDDPAVNTAYRFLEHLTRLTPDTPDSVIGVISSVWEYLNRDVLEEEAADAEEGADFNRADRFLRFLATVRDDTPDKRLKIMGRVWDYIVKYDVRDEGDYRRAYCFLEKLCSMPEETPVKQLDLLDDVWRYLGNPAVNDEDDERIGFNFIKHVMKMSVDSSPTAFDVASSIWGSISGRRASHTEHYSSADGFMRQLAKFPQDLAPGMSGILDKIWKFLDRYDSLAEDDESLEDEGFYPIDEQDIKDTYTFLECLAALPSDTPLNIMGFVEEFWAFFLNYHVVDEEGVKKKCDFMKNLAKAFEHHASYELGTFFELYDRPSIDEDSDRAMRDFDEISRLLKRSTSARTKKEDNRELMEKRHRKRLETRAGELGLEYLMLSAAIDEKKSNPSVKDPKENFARRVQSLNRLGIGAETLVRNMELCKRRYIDGEELDEGEMSVLRSTLLRERTKNTEMRELKRRIERILDDGPVDCPDKLRAHIREHCGGVEVEKIWDFRHLQFTLYFSDPAIQYYNKLRKKQSDPGFVRNIVMELAVRDLLEQEVLVAAGACGYAENEVLLSSQIRRMDGPRGPRSYSDVWLNLYDLSDKALETAVDNALRAGFEADVKRQDIQELPEDWFDDINRQVVFLLLGGTFFNWANKYGVADNLSRIFKRRDKRTPGGLYTFERHDLSGPRKPDILLVEGDIDKPLSYYSHRFSQRFLAEGLSAGYDLRPEDLSNEQGELQHTLYYDDTDMVLQCIYVITKDKGPFKKDQAIWVIDSGYLHENEFRDQAFVHDLHSEFIYGNRRSSNKALALCYLNEYAEYEGEDIPVSGSDVIKRSSSSGMPSVFHPDTKKVDK